MRAIDAGLLVCHECHQLNPIEPEVEHQHCSRCGGLVHARRPNSLVRTWALLLTSMNTKDPHAPRRTWMLLDWGSHLQSVSASSTGGLG